MRLADISFWDMVSSLFPSLSAAAAVAAAVTLFQASGIVTNNARVVRFISEVAVGGAVGMSTLLCLDTQLRLAVRRILLTIHRPPVVSMQAE
jgi:hypothetical protein